MTLSGLHTKIEMSFLVVGLTKFSPDSHFGLIKQRYRNSSVYTYDQLVNIIDESAKKQYNICRPYSNSDSTDGIIYRDWTTWLGKYFLSIPNITSYQHFIMSEKDRGAVFVKTAIDLAEKKINLFKNDCDFDADQKKGMPELLFPKGTSIERQWYLYEQIREHIPGAIDKDLTCPKPTQQKPKKANNNHVKLDENFTKT